MNGWRKMARAATGYGCFLAKKGGPITLKASEALEEALCFGWIDGQMQSMGETKYKKYFARRTPNSKWSSKNKALAEKLEKEGIMSERGREKIEEAKKNGQWSRENSLEITGEK